MTDEPTRSRGGRPRDPSRDAAILGAALEVLGEHGYERMTMDQVATRAGASKATVYRRWTSKGELVLDAVRRLDDRPSLDSLPDTGTLRGDLVALMQPQSPDDEARTLAVVGGLASLLSADPALAEAASAVLVAPYVASQRLLMTRARDRGEIPADADIETVAHVTPSMTAYRLIVQRQPIDVDHLRHLVDVVVMPALLAGGPVGDSTG